MLRKIRDLLESVDLPDPHEFATAYVDHVATTGERIPLPLAVARWVASGVIA